MVDGNKMIGLLHDELNCTKEFVMYLSEKFKEDEIHCVTYSIAGDSETTAENVRLCHPCAVICVVLASTVAVHEEERCRSLNAALDEKSSKNKTILVLDDMLDKNANASFKQLKEKKMLLHRVKCSVRDFATWTEKKKQKLAKELMGIALNKLKDPVS